MSISKRIEDTQESLEKYSNSFDNDISKLESFANIAKELAPSTQDADIIELVFRGLLEKFLSSSKSIETLLHNNGNIISLIKFSLALGPYVTSSSLSETGLTTMAKMPFLLIEDMLDSLSIKNAENIWGTIENLIFEYTSNHPEFLGRGKLVLLRMCNSLLKKLSKSCNTAFCGRVLMFLTAILPISERSGINLMGKINTTNVTDYETAEDYENNINNNNDDSKMDIDNKTDTSTNIKYDYDIYQKFWKLQSFFSEESKTFESVQRFKDFKNCVDFILKQFEDRPYSSAYIKQASETRLRTLLSTINSSGTNNVDTNDDIYMGCKFLTSSQLFSLQLQDPQLRLQIITQLLYMVRFVKFTPISLTTSSSGINSKSKIGKAELEKEEEEMRIYLNSLETRLFQLLHVTPYGKEFDSLIRRMLQREGNWLTWKTMSCPEFEKREVKIDINNNTNASSESVPAKIKDYKVALLQDDVQATAKNIFTSPDFWEYIDEYEQAEDPEQGIEEQYHPKHNPLYCWRGRRLMSERYLKVFADMLDGNIGRGLKSIKGINTEGDGSESKANDTDTVDETNSKTDIQESDNNADTSLVQNESKNDDMQIDNNDSVLDVEDGEVEDGEAPDGKKRKRA